VVQLKPSFSRKRKSVIGYLLSSVSKSYTDFENFRGTCAIFGVGGGACREELVKVVDTGSVLLSVCVCV
jgi:hypothetical protein